MNNLFDKLYFERGWDHLMHVVQKQGLIALWYDCRFMRERPCLDDSGDHGTFDRQDEKDFFDGTDESISPRSIRNPDAPASETSRQQPSKDLSNRPEVYRTMGVNGTPVQHPSDLSKVTDRILPRKVAKTFHLNVCFTPVSAKFVNARMEGDEKNADVFLDHINRLFQFERDYDKEMIMANERTRRRQGLETMEVMINLRANLAKRAIPPFTTKRENSLHFGSDSKAEMAATYHSVISTVKLQSKSTWDYLGKFSL